MGTTTILLDCDTGNKVGIVLLFLFSAVHARRLEATGSNATQTQPALQGGVLHGADICRQDYPGIPFKWSPAEKVLALTFDDGPQLQSMTAVLDVLKAEQVQATFFVNTHMREKAGFPAFTSQPVQELLRRLLAEGHELGSHAAQHDPLTKLASSKVEQLLKDAIDSISRLTGDTVPLFRAPFGDGYDIVPSPPWTPENAQRVQKVVRRHHVHVGWSFDAKDWSIGGSDAACSDRLFNAYGPPLVKNGTTGVVLMHSLQWAMGGCPEALQRVIAYYKNAGYTFVKASMLVHELYGMSPAEVVQRAQACN